MNDTNLLTEHQAAERLACSVAALRRWRQEGRGPAHYKVGRLVRYSPADLDAFLAAQRVSTRPAEGGAQ